MKKLLTPLLIALSFFAMAQSPSKEKLIQRFDNAVEAGKDKDAFLYANLIESTFGKDSIVQFKKALLFYQNSITQQAPPDINRNLATISFIENLLPIYKDTKDGVKLTYMLVLTRFQLIDVYDFRAYLTKKQIKDVMEATKTDAGYVIDNWPENNDAMKKVLRRMEGNKELYLSKS